MDTCSLNRIDEWCWYHQTFFYKPQHSLALLLFGLSSQISKISFITKHRRIIKMMCSANTVRINRVQDSWANAVFPRTTLYKFSTRFYIYIFCSVSLYYLCFLFKNWKTSSWHSFHSIFLRLISISSITHYQWIFFPVIVYPWTHHSYS